VNIDAFYPYVLPHVLGCPNPVAVHHIRQAAIEFCNKTRWHEEECSASNAGGGNVFVEADTDLEVVSISTVYVDGREYRSKSRQSGLALIGAGSLEQFYCVVRTGEGEVELAVNPAPDKSVPVRAVATLRPTMAANTISNELSEWMDGIASGAAHRIAAIPAQAFSNPAISVYHRDLFNEAVKTAKVKKYMGSSETSAPRRADVF